MNEMRLPEEFKGFWIPKEIWLNKELNMLEKVVFSEIDKLDDGLSGCWASNKYLSEYCQCSESKITKTVKLLKEKGLIRESNFDGRHRVLRVNEGYKPKFRKPLQQNQF